MRDCWELAVDWMEQAKKPEDVTGVILAGGRSTRMGKDKATLKIFGDSLFERILQAMVGVFPRVLIAGDRPDLATPDVPCHPDLFPGSALGGIYTGLVVAQTPLVFVSACDLPYPDSRLIRCILAHRKGHDVVVPKTSHGLEPLFALYRKTCIAPMHDMLLRGEYRVYDFYPQMDVRYLEVDELTPGWEQSLMNVNTPEQYEAVKRNKGCILPPFALFDAVRTKTDDS